MGHATMQQSSDTFEYSLSEIHATMEEHLSDIEHSIKAFVLLQLKEAKILDASQQLFYVDVMEDHLPDALLLT
jgi:hypothetical protein